MRKEKEREGRRRGGRGTEREAAPKGVEENQLRLILMRQAAWPHVVSSPWSPDVCDVNSRCDCSWPQTGVSDRCSRCGGSGPRSVDFPQHSGIYPSLCHVFFLSPEEEYKLVPWLSFREKVRDGGRRPGLQSPLTGQLHLGELSNCPLPENPREMPTTCVDLSAST